MRPLRRGNRNVLLREPPSLPFSFPIHPPAVMISVHHPSRLRVEGNMRRTWGDNLWVAAAALALIASSSAATAAERVPDYESDIKPILQRHCFGCHGEEKQKGGLRLDVKEVALRGGDSGEPAIVPGSTVKSHLIKLVSSNDPDEVMPPKGERLKAEEVALIQKWIETGAHWTDVKKAVEATQGITELVITEKDRAHWSFVAPKRHAPPVTKMAGWARSTIDPFVL